MDDNRNVPFPGLIDDARIYNRALSGSEIAYLCAGPVQLSVAPAGSSIMVFWSPPAGGWLWSKRRRCQRPRGHGRGCPKLV